MAMKIGEKIKTFRKSRNISQEALAKALGVTFQAVSKWETNVTAPDVSLIPAIASYFEVPIDELLITMYWKMRKRSTASADRLPNIA